MADSHKPSGKLHATFLLLAAAAAARAAVSPSPGEGESATCGCEASRSSGGGSSNEYSAEPLAQRFGLPPSPLPPRLLQVVLIPAGRGPTLLGSDSGHFPEDGEGPAFNYIQGAPFWMDATEVSNARFAAFAAATGYVSEAEEYGWSFVHELAVPEATKARIEQSVKGAEWWLPVPNASWAHPEGLESNVGARWDHPAVHLSHRDAASFCAHAGGRLPREDEWEYAARGGKPGRTYPWGNALVPGGRHRANIWQGVFPHNNTAEDGVAWTAAVDSFGPQNAFGLYHVVGNVWEWTADAWCPGTEEADAGIGAAKARAAKRVAPECKRMTAAAFKRWRADPGEVDFVKKGGSFLCHLDYCFRYRVAARHKNSRNSSAQNLGARCVYDGKPAWAADGGAVCVAPDGTTTVASAHPQ
jgi:sulfatase modifying factor 1